MAGSPRLFQSCMKLACNYIKLCIRTVTESENGKLDASESAFPDAKTVRPSNPVASKISKTQSCCWEHRHHLLSSKHRQQPPLLGAHQCHSHPPTTVRGVILLAAPPRRPVQRAPGHIPSQFRREPASTRHPPTTARSEAVQNVRRAAGVLGAPPTRGVLTLNHNVINKVLDQGVDYPPVQYAQGLYSVQ